MVIKTYDGNGRGRRRPTLTWSLEGNDAGDFSITRNSQRHGELKFSQRAQLRAWRLTLTT